MAMGCYLVLIRAIFKDYSVSRTWMQKWCEDHINGITPHHRPTCVSFFRNKQASGKAGKDMHQTVGGSFSSSRIYEYEAALYWLNTDHNIVCKKYTHTS